MHYSLFQRVAMNKYFAAGEHVPSFVKTYYYSLVFSGILELCGLIHGDATHRREDL